MTEPGRGAITRREALRNLAIAGVGAAGLAGAADELVAQAVAASPKHGRLRDIEHVVILIQENRSFDHYFGTYSGVRGFGDHAPHDVWHQRGLNGKTLHPFHFDTGCMADLTHDWQPQHESWNGGRMNGFLKAHETFDPVTDGVSSGPETMGYYKREDLPFYFSLAEAFTLCDGYHCSVLGPTDPNRLMSMSASIDPAGTHGGPLVETNTPIDERTGLFSWTTMPERLSAHGVSWKVYQSPAGGILDNVLTYFKQYRPGTEIYDRGINTTYPDDFAADLAANRLPRFRGSCSESVRPSIPTIRRPIRESRALARSSSRWSRIRTSGARPRCSSPGTRTAASLTTCDRPPRPRGQRGSG